MLTFTSIPKPITPRVTEPVAAAYRGRNVLVRLLQAVTAFFVVRIGR